MSYNEQFFQLYTDYIKEPTVRAAHDWVFKIAAMNPAFEKVLDLGCGMCQEWRKYGPVREYLGVDVLTGKQQGFTAIRLDYRTGKLDDAFPEATAFVSLFSSEITAGPLNNDILYRSLFRYRPAIKSGLVSGFYYADKRDQNPVEEPGGITSFQTLSNIEDRVPNPGFTERRIVMSVPSELFGPNVIEVWRFFDRK